MTNPPRPHVGTTMYHGLFRLDVSPEGRASVVRAESASTTVSCPSTGRPLRVATLQAGATAICPRCEVEGRGGFASFVADLRMVYACPACRELVWLAGL